MVTEHTRRLNEKGFLLSRSRRIENVKRPIEELRLNPDAGTCLALRLQRDSVQADLLQVDASPLQRFERHAQPPDQHGLMNAINQVVGEALQYAAQNGRFIAYSGMGVFGAIAPEPGIIFDVEGLDQWEPCQPGKILAELLKIPDMSVWTEAACKLRGLASQLEQDHRLGYVEFNGQHFHVATIQNGQVEYGRYGTQSRFLHRSVVENGSVCYCGRHGCLADYLRRDHLDHAIIAQALLSWLDSLEVDHLGICWAGDHELIEQGLADSSIRTIVPVEEPDRLLTEGLHALVVEATLGEMLQPQAVPAPLR